MLKRILISLIVTFSINYSYSQYEWTDGEIILKSGEVHKGLVTIPMISKDLIAINSRKVTLKEGPNNERMKFGEDEVKLIKFFYPDNEVAYYEYVSVSETRKEIFCIVVSGKATLYARGVRSTTSGPGTMSFNSSDEYYVQKDGEEIALPLITIRISRSFKKRAIDYFSDCPSLVAKLEDKILKKVDVIEVVEKYNECVD